MLEVASLHCQVHPDGHVDYQCWWSVGYVHHIGHVVQGLCAVWLVALLGCEIQEELSDSVLHEGHDSLEDHVTMNFHENLVGHVAQMVPGVLVALDVHAVQELQVEQLTLSET